MQATSLGEVARQVSGENELWLATALTHAALQARTPPSPNLHLQVFAATSFMPACVLNPLLSAELLLQNLAASQLAGVASALIAAESASRPAISAAYEPSQPVCHAIEALEADRERLYDLQLQAGVAQPLNSTLR